MPDTEAPDDNDWDGVQWDPVDPAPDPGVPIELTIHVTDEEHLPRVHSFTVARDTVVVLERPAGADPTPKDQLMGLVDDIARVVQHPAFVVFEVVGGTIRHACTKDQSWAAIVRSLDLVAQPPTFHALALANELRSIADRLEATEEVA